MKTYLVNFDYPIVLASLIVWLAGTIVLSCVIRKELAALIMFLKITLFISYFCFFADGTWFYGGDDWGYFERGLRMAQAEPNIFRIWTHPEGFYLRHGHSLALVYFHNYVSILLFGEYYFAPVLLNIFLTSIIVTLLTASLKTSEVSALYVKYFVIYASLHWSTLVWSSFLNLKGMLVTTLMALMIWGISISSRKSITAIIAVTLSAYLMLRSRFYFPAIVGIGVVVGYINQLHAIIQKNRQRSFAIACAVVALVLWKASLLPLFFRHADFSGAVYGALHFVLQPAPWKITEPASYLLLPSILHWIMLPATIAGCVLLWRSGGTKRIMVGIIVAGVLFYGLVPAIASTRHRIPFDILFIIAQFQFLWTYTLQAFGRVEKR